jgi:hypothetical protein
MLAVVSRFSHQRWVEQVIDLEQGLRFQTFGQPSFTMVHGRLEYRFWQDRLDVGVVGTNVPAHPHPAIVDQLLPWLDQLALQRGSTAWCRHRDGVHDNMHVESE